MVDPSSLKRTRPFMGSQGRAEGRRGAGREEVGRALRGPQGGVSKRIGRRGCVRPTVVTCYPEIWYLLFQML